MVLIATGSPQESNQARRLVRNRRQGSPLLSYSRGTAGSGCKLEHLQVGNQTSFERSINTSLALAGA